MKNCSHFLLLLTVNNMDDFHVLRYREQETVNKSCDACNKTDDVVVPTDGCGEDKEENVETHKGCDSENSDENFDELDDTEEIEVTSDGNCLVKPLMFQKGVLRTNCIDCLDRTNVAQYAYGLAALGRQLHALGLIDVPKIGLDSPLADELMHFYERMGDTLALQYGGSAAHNKVYSSNVFVMICIEVVTYSIFCTSSVT